MSVSKEYAKPDSEGDFEEMCHQLYKLMWEDLTCVRVGRVGQAQFGVDILGVFKSQRVGVQCKHFNKTAFTLSTVLSDIRKADAATDLQIDHLLFATTAGSDPKLILAVAKLSEERKTSKKFTVSIDFWGDLCGHLRMHPQVGRVFISDFPGSFQLEVLEASSEHLAIAKDTRQAIDLSHVTLAAIESHTSALVTAYNKSLQAPEAKGDEADPYIVAKLDTVRDALREGRTTDAKNILEAIGSPDDFKDQFSKFRWHTNWATIEIEEGRAKSGAEGYIRAFDFATDNETASVNRAHGLFILGRTDESFEACEEGIRRFGDTANLWAVKIHAMHAIGVADPEANIPEEIKQHHELLFSRARLASMKKEFRLAVELLDLCLSSDKASFSTKRALLIESLEWAIQDPARARNFHLSQEIKSALTRSIDHLEPLEQTLPKIQSEAISEEVACNVVNALWLVGKDERVQAISSVFLHKHPSAEPLLRVRVLYLAGKKNIEEIRRLTDHQLDTLPLPVLTMLAEVAATLGVPEWYKDVVRHIEDRDYDSGVLTDIRLLDFQLKWAVGDRDSAIQGLRDHLRNHPSHVLGHIVLTDLLLRADRRAEALDQCHVCSGIITGEALFYQIQLAELFFRLEDFEAAANLYEALVTEPSADEMTINFLISLIETDQRWKVQSTLDRLSNTERQNPTIRRIECNLARRTSNWARLEELLELEIARCPESAQTAVAYAGALYRVGKLKELRDFLAKDSKFKKSSPESEFEFAKYQVHAGLASLAIARLYALYRGNPDSTKIAGYYLSQVLLAPLTTEMNSPEQITATSAVLLRNSTEEWWILIDESSSIGSWPEQVVASSPMAAELIGKKNGDSVTVARGAGSCDAEVVDVISAYVFAVRKAQERLAASAAQDGPLWSVKAYKTDGELDVDAIATPAKERRKLVETAFSSYKKNKIPLSLLAKWIGTDLITLMLEWPYSQFDMFVSTGTQAERDEAIRVIKASDKTYVIDLATATELTRLGLFDQFIRVVGNPFVAQSVKDEVSNILQLHTKQKPAATLADSGNGLVLFEANSEEHARRTIELERILENLDKCHVSPTIGSPQVDENIRRYAQVLDEHVIDSFYLSVEKGAVLFSEDGTVRLLAKDFGVADVAWIQPFMMVGLESGVIALDSYVAGIVAMIQTGRDFISVRTEDLAHAAKAKATSVSSSVKTMLDTCKRPTIDFPSAATVAMDFLRFVLVNMSPRIAGGYACEVRDALCAGRDEFKDKIIELISIRLQQAYGRNGRRLKISDRRYFQGLLKRSLGE
ncbi:hypothetical protein [Pseudoxanthomonas sp. CF125]|uniref:PIN domain-containing protein n=1 Tax=Pseudoxanthomonas sp. CF125 TaxID=1855303 RepID=UPI00088FAA6D|nr:hypothetical protein [Pseudoxanthomonas sp. CF125]SDR10798.1 hypothetical protein SAMN05216569_3131 [Pseudoxanthomonas sp. CF125]